METGSSIREHHDPFEWLDETPQDVLEPLIFGAVDERAKEAFFKEFAMWQHAAGGARAIDMRAARDIVREADLDGLVPQMDTYDETILARAYYRQTRLHGQVTAFISDIEDYTSVLSEARKCMKDSARLMFTGTDKDKDAKAGSVLRNIAISHSILAGLLKRLEEFKSHLSYCQKQMESLHWDRAHLLKRNLSMLSEGASHVFADTDDRPTAHDLVSPRKTALGYDLTSALNSL